MNRSMIRRALPFIALAFAAAGCADREEPETLPENPIQMRVEPIRQRTSETDSLMRARERAVAEISDQV